MNRGNTDPRLLSVALCALMVILLIKLSATVIGAFNSDRDAACDVSEAIAREDKPKAEAERAAPAEAPARAKPSAAESLSVIQQKEIEVRKREEQLRDKEEHLSKLEKEVEQKVQDLLALQKQVQAVQTEKHETQNAKVRGIAKIYGTMKPKEAAKLLENLDDKLVMGIIGTMTPDQAAAILSLMEVKKAAKISEALYSK